MYQDMFAVIAPVFVCAAIGFIWSKAGWPYHGEFVSRLVMSVGAPCLILSGLTKVELPSDDFWQMLGLSFLAFSLMLLLSVVFLKISRRKLEVYLPGMVFPNTGNMGLPICLLAFGSEGLALALTFFVISSVLHFSLGLAVVSQRSWQQTLLRTPIFYAAVVALIVVLSGVSLSPAISNSLELLAGFSIPLMLIALGVSLASLSIKQLQRSLVIVLGRWFLGALVVSSLIWVFDVSGLMRSVLIIQLMMPVAVFNYLLAQQYRQGPEIVAGAVVISTLLSFLSLPFLLFWASA